MAAAGTIGLLAVNSAPATDATRIQLYSLDGISVKQKDTAGTVTTLGGVSAITTTDATLVQTGTLTIDLKRAAITGDVTIGLGSNAAVLAATGPGVTGPIGSASVTPVISIDAKGRVTALTSATITPAAIGAPSGTGTHSGTSSGTNTGDQTITLTGGVTGSGTGSFAATVVTNANLTGPVTSVGNATSIGAHQITAAMQSQIGAHSYRGNNTGSTADVADISVANLTADLVAATISAQGAMSASDKSKMNNFFENNWYNVQDHGVAPGNTAAANVTAINALFAIAPAGSEIYFPAGTYQFNAAWNGGVALTNNYVFSGVRGGTSLSWSANVGGDLIKTTATGYYTEFRDIQFTTTVAQTAGYVIHFGDGAVSPIVRNCIFTGTSGTQTLAGLMSFDNAGAQGANSGNLAYVYDCLGGNYTGIGININSNLAQLVVKGLVLNGKTSSGVNATSCITVLSCGYLQLDNCDLIGGVNNLALTPTVGLVTASVFANNTFFDQSSQSSLKIGGAGTVVRAHFIGCWFTLQGGVSGTQAVEISTSGTSVHQGVLFSACHVFNTPAATTSNGFTITAAGDVTIEGCQIAGWTTGISVTPVATAGTTILNIGNNIIGTSGGVGANVTGIALAAGGATYGSVVVQGNTFIGNTTPLTDASTVSGSANKVINGNAGMTVGATAKIAASAAINTTETYILNPVSLPANGLQVGTTLRATIHGTCTSTVANVSTFTVRIGTTGTTPASDTTATAALATSAAAASGTTVPFTAKILLTCRAIGASTLWECGLMLVNTGVTGIMSVATGGALVATGTYNNNVNLFLNISYKSAATTTTSTFQMGAWEVIAQ